MLDGRGHLLGRLAAIVAKQVLLGKSACCSQLLPDMSSEVSDEQKSPSFV